MSSDLETLLEYAGLDVDIQKTMLSLSSDIKSLEANLKELLEGRYTSLPTLEPKSAGEALVMLKSFIAWYNANSEVLKNAGMGIRKQRIRDFKPTPPPKVRTKINK